MFTNNNFKQRISILEVVASGEQVGGIGKIIVKNLFKCNYIKLMNLQIKNYFDLKFMMNSRNVKKNSSSKNLRS